MKRKKGILFFFLPVAILPAILSHSGCRNATRGEDRPEPVVTVSVLPQKYFIESITGGKVQVNVMIPAGASPASYEPTSRQMQQLDASGLYVMNGHLGFEKAWEGKIRENYPGLEMIRLTDHVDLITGGHHGADPHIWMSPKTVRLFLPALYSYLKEVYPEMEEWMEIHYARLMARVDSVDRLMEDSFRDLASRKFIIFHPALTYLARDYGLQQYAMEEEGKEPSVHGMRNLVELARRENIRVIFIQEEFDQENARTLAAEIGGKVISLNPLDPDWDDNMEKIRNTLVSVLQPQEEK
ncbi:MAG TPA: zinc ABC transporter substrate-binding protein [Bacteroidetes bacterium]|nr:zinc ABC transporter substrate-binding protein [Bacteroidota bacterium]